MASRIRYARLATERANPRSRALDLLSPRAIAGLMNREDRRAVLAVGRARSAIASAVNMIVAALRGGGRLFFVGAGTSGRLGVIEAAECPPTFGTAPQLVQAIMAGGRGAVFRSREGAEDDEVAARQAVLARVRRGDVVVGISASGVTPFVRSALEAARRRGAGTVLVTCNARGLGRLADQVRIAPAEVAGAYPNRLELQGEEHPAEREDDRRDREPELAALPELAVDDPRPGRFHAVR